MWWMWVAIYVHETQKSSIAPKDCTPLQSFLPSAPAPHNLWSASVTIDGFTCHINGTVYIHVDLYTSIICVIVYVCSLCIYYFIVYIARPPLRPASSADGSAPQVHHAAVGISSPGPFCFLSSLPSWVCTLLFLRSPVMDYSGCFQSLATINQAAMNSHIKSLWGYFSGINTWEWNGWIMGYVYV